MIYFARQLAKRKLASGTHPILVTSCHPGTVDTDIQEAPAETYGVVGKVFDVVARTLGKSAPEGAEASLWLATCTDMTAANLAEYQV